ncbi:MAG: nucleoside-diphosphate sugar epimerase/dehydratase [Arcanobacterium sp.]|nr:nucleoside-diphosphate sugar epimerase/dehydratase [Arcanobacterium sp.]
MLIDVLSWVAAVVAVSWLRFDFNLSDGDIRGIVAFVVTAIVVQIAVGVITKHYRNRYWLASFEEVVTLALLVFVSGVAGVLFTIFVYPGYFVSRAVAATAPPVALLIMSVARVVWRLLKKVRRQGAADPEPVILIGAGRAAEQLIRQLQMDIRSPYEAVALIDDALAKQNLRLHGVPVRGTRDDFERVAKAQGVKTAIFAIYSAEPEVENAYSEIAKKAGVKLLVVPQVSELLEGKVDLSQIRQLNVSDLLGRRQVKTNLSEVAGYIAGKRVLVTGAGGTIGSELCRQVKALNPAELVLLDRDESELHAMELELYGTGLLNTPNFALCDIRDREALREIFEAHHPEVVFHAAALKHLPMLEQYPEEGWKTNVLGSKNVVELAEEYGVTNLVNISTDKAANPTTVLGRTKRMAERIVAFYSRKNAHKGWKYVSVRFGNVLGSRGSVLWTFTSQIEKGGPVTITHPDVERFFMTIPEACALVMQAGAIGRAGEVLVLDMGTPVKIMDVAKRMIAMSGKDVEIKIVGLRPGEKISEVLHFEGEVDERPFHPLISHTQVPQIEPEAIESEHANTAHHDKMLYE